MEKSKPNLIGLSGKIGSGKSTVAKIIQYIMYKEKFGFRLDLDLTSKSDYSVAGWTVKKFAYKLKLMASMLIGIPVQDLELQSVKDRVLGPEWSQFNLTYQFDYVRPEELQKELSNPNVVAVDLTPVHINYDRKYVTLMHKEVKMTVRKLLQSLGTNAMRDVVHPNIHVNALFADYNCPECGSIPDKVCFGHRVPNWIIEDTRFLNEAKAIEERGGILIRVERPGQGTDTHQSEIELDGYQFKYTIHNNGSLDDLIASVKVVLRKEGLTK